MMWYIVSEVEMQTLVIEIYEWQMIRWNHILHIISVDNIFVDKISEPNMKASTTNLLFYWFTKNMDTTQTQSGLSIVHAPNTG